MLLSRPLPRCMGRRLGQLRTVATKATICVVGTGPGGFYTAKYLLQDPSIHVDMIDALPTPYGLVRSGVAPDHPEVKNVQDDFSSVAGDPRLCFLGNVAVGKDVSAEELTQLYDGVVLAYGAASDRLLGIPGEDLGNVCSARAFVNWYNGHPDFSDFKPNLDATDVVVVGQGNVAIDCARILVKTVDELRHTDIASHALEALSRSRVQRVHVIGRRGHVQAAFTMKELRELTKLQDAEFVVHPDELEKGRTAASVAEIEKQRAKKRMDALLAEQVRLRAAGGPSRSRQLILRFLLGPARALPDAADATRVGAVECDVTRLDGPPEDQKALPTGAKEVVPAQMVLRSIGYKSIPVPGVPFDHKRHVVHNRQGRVVHADGTVIPGLYVSGWLKRGPTGIIGTNITDAKETVACILEDRALGKLAPMPASGLRGLDGLTSLLTRKGKHPQDVVTWEAYQRIDAEEASRGQKLSKPREKLTSIDDMLKVARGR